MILIYWPVVTLIWLAVWLPFYVLGFAVTWIGLLLTPEDAEHMPILFWPWDNSHGVNGTLDGNNPGWRIKCGGKERTFKNRWIWVTWRNPVSNLSLYPLGFVCPPQYDAKQWELWRVRVERVTCRAAPWLRSYSLFIYWSSHRYFQTTIGWKVNDTITSGGRSRFMYRISPWRTY